MLVDPTSCIYVASLLTPVKDPRLQIVLSAAMMFLSHYEDEEAGWAEEWAQATQPEVRKRVQNRLSQRRHRAKVRQQRGAISQEIIVPPSFTSSFPIDSSASAVGSSNNALAFDNKNNSQNLMRMEQPQDKFDTFENFTDQNMLYPTQGQPPSEIVQRPQREQIGTPRLSQPLNTPLRRPGTSNSFQQNNMQLTSVEQHSPLPAEPSNDYWNTHPLADPKWSPQSYHQNQASVPLPSTTVGTPRPPSSHLPRNMSISFASQQPTNPQRTPSRASDMQQSSPIHQRHFLEQAYSPRLSTQLYGHLDSHLKTHLENSGSELAAAREENYSHSQCHSCRGSSSSEDQPMNGAANHNTPASTVSRGSSSQMSIQENMEMITNTGIALANMPGQNDYQEERESSRRPNLKRRSTSSRDRADSSADSNSQDDDYPEIHGLKGVEKVVIVYVKNRRPKS